MGFIPTLIVIVVSVMTMVYFYLKCSLMKSISTFWSAVIAMIIAFSYYEFVVGLFLSKGYVLAWVDFGSFLLLFVMSFAVLRASLDYLAPSMVDLGKPIMLTAVVICGLLTSVILSGIVLVAIGMIPKQGKVFYSRFDPERTVLTADPDKPALNMDGFVVGLYSWISSGSLSSAKSFSVIRSDFLTQTHLNKLKVPEVMSVCEADAISLPREKALKPIRRDAENKHLIVRVGINTRDIGSGSMQFFLGQIRLIAKKPPLSNKPFKGSGKSLYPVGLWHNGKIKKVELSKVINTKSLDQESNKAWLDIVFENPEKLQPVLLQFKQKTMLDVSHLQSVDNTPEIENALNEENAPVGDLSSIE